VPQTDSIAERLRALIRDVPDFPRPGIVFKDITPLLRDAAALRASVSAMTEPYAAERVDVVAGIESRGFILGAAIAFSLKAGFVAIRKQGRLPSKTILEEYSLEYGNAVLEIHADSVSAGQRVLIVDDLLATGGTARAATTLLRRLGGEVVALSFLIELTFLKGADMIAGTPYSAVIKY
jgi:adenine phosphoribosyltransferase